MKKILVSCMVVTLIISGCNGNNNETKYNEEIAELTKQVEELKAENEMIRSNTKESKLADDTLDDDTIDITTLEGLKEGLGDLCQAIADDLKLDSIDELS